MSTASVVTSSRVWSCSTLRDGVDYLLEEANKAEDEELELEKLVQETLKKNFSLQPLLYMNKADVSFNGWAKF